MGLEFGGRRDEVFSTGVLFRFPIADMLLSMMARKQVKLTWEEMSPLGRTSKFRM